MNDHCVSPSPPNLPVTDAMCRFSEMQDIDALAMQIKIGLGVHTELQLSIKHAHPQ